MNTEELLFALLRVAVCGETASEELNNACTDEQLGRVYALASRYDVAHLVGQALGKLNVGANEAAELCKKSTMRAVYRYVGMSNAYETVCQVLEAAPQRAVLRSCNAKRVTKIWPKNEIKIKGRVPNHKSRATRGSLLWLGTLTLTFPSSVKS